MEVLAFEPKKENLEFLEQELSLAGFGTGKARFSLNLKSLRQKTCPQQRGRKIL